MKFLFASLSFSLIFACSDGHSDLTYTEKNYLQTQDSLRKYQKEVLEFDKDTMSIPIQDYIHLNYQNFKSKHKLDENQINQLTELFTIRYEMGRLLREINNNTFKKRIKKLK